MRNTESNLSFLEGPMILRVWFNKAELREPMVNKTLLRPAISGKIFTGMVKIFTAIVKSFWGSLGCPRKLVTS